jgi:3-oxoacyl-(acyl-carrier-protein) synthase
VNSPVIRLNIRNHARHFIQELSHAGLWSQSSNGSLAIDPQRCAVVFSASKNLFATQDRATQDWLSLSSDSSASYVAQRIGATGPRLSPVAACATGSHCISVGAQHIQDGYVDVAICGAIEPILTPLVMAAYRNMGALSKRA